MARVNIAAQAFPGGYPTLPVAANSLDLALTAADTGDGNMATLNRRRTCLLAINTHASAAGTVTVTSVADTQGRTGDITAYSLAAGEIGLFGPFDTPGWVQPDDATDPGKLYFSGSAATMKFAVIDLPAR